MLLKAARNATKALTLLFLSRTASRGSEETTIESSDLGAGLEAGNVPLRQMFCDFEPAGTECSGSGQKGSEVGGLT